MIRADFERSVCVPLATVSALDVCSRFIGVGRSAFARFYRDEFHPAFWAISRMISYDFGMHRAGVLLHRFVLHLRAIGIP